MNTGGDLLNIACEKIAELEVPAFIKDSELRYVIVNDAYAQFFREEPEAFAGKTDRELFGHLEDGVRDDRERQVVVFGDEQTTLVFDSLGHGRYPLRVERFFGDDDSIYVFGMFEETPVAETLAGRADNAPTAAKEPAESTAKSNGSDELFLATLEDLPVATYVRGADHRMVFVNAAFVDMVGVPKERLLGKTEHECFPARGDEYHAANRRTLEDGVTVRGGGCIPSPRRHRRAGDLARQPYRDAERRALHGWFDHRYFDLEKSRDPVDRGAGRGRGPASSCGKPAQIDASWRSDPRC